MIQVPWKIFYILCIWIILKTLSSKRYGYVTFSWTAVSCVTQCNLADYKNLSTKEDRHLRDITAFVQLWLPKFLCYWRYETSFTDARQTSTNESNCCTNLVNIFNTASKTTAMFLSSLLVLHRNLSWPYPLEMYLCTSNVHR